MPARSLSSSPVNLVKLAVGVPSLEEFESRVEARRRAGSGMQVWTRSFPKRADEVIGVGSLYWVVAGLVAARQPILAIEADSYADGSRCARIEVEPVLIRVAAIRMRPFQGWRYLEPTASPADLGGTGAAGLDALPPAVLRELRELCLV